MVTNTMYVVGEFLRVDRSSASCAGLNVWLEGELGTRRSAMQGIQLEMKIRTETTATSTPSCLDFSLQRSAKSA